MDFYPGRGGVRSSYPPRHLSETIREHFHDVHGKEGSLLDEPLKAALVNLGEHGVFAGGSNAEDFDIERMPLVKVCR